jgi:hypothetical protein
MLIIAPQMWSIPYIFMLVMDQSTLDNFSYNDTRIKKKVNRSYHLQLACIPSVKDKRNMTNLYYLIILDI